MSLKWFEQLIVTSVVEWATFGVLAWGLAKWKLRPFLRKHGPRLLAMLGERDQHD